RPPTPTLFPYTTLFRSEYPIQLSMYNTTMEPVVLQSPMDAQTDIPTKSILRWEDYPNANQFEVQVSTTPDFSTLLDTGIVNSTRSEEHTSELQSRENLV